MSDVRFLITSDSAGQRLDAFLGAQDSCPSRSACAKLVETGAVCVNGDTCTSKKLVLAEGDRIEVEVPDPVEVGTRGRPSYSVGHSLRGRLPHRALQAARARMPSRSRARFRVRLRMRWSIIAVSTIWARFQGEDRPGYRAPPWTATPLALCSLPKTTIRSARCKTSFACVRSTGATSLCAMATSLWTRAPSTRALPVQRATA